MLLVCAANAEMTPDIRKRQPEHSKNNATGAQGRGRDARTRLNVSISPASKKEVAQALGVSKIAVQAKQRQ